jgi:tetratricopeptide (TPR) repeat protein
MAIERDRRLSRSYAEGASGYLLCQEPESALADASRAVELANRNRWAFINRGLAYASVDDYARASNDFTAAVALDPKQPLAHVLRAEVYLWLERYREAQADAQEARRLINGMQPRPDTTADPLARRAQRAFDSALNRGR